MQKRLPKPKQLKLKLKGRSSWPPRCMTFASVAELMRGVTDEVQAERDRVYRKRWGIDE